MRISPVNVNNNNYKNTNFGNFNFRFDNNSVEIADDPNMVYIQDQKNLDNALALGYSTSPKYAKEISDLQEWINKLEAEIKRKTAEESEHEYSHLY